MFVWMKSLRLDGFGELLEVDRRPDADGHRSNSIGDEHQPQRTEDGRPQTG